MQQLPPDPITLPAHPSCAVPPCRRQAQWAAKIVACMLSTHQQHPSAACSAGCCLASNRLPTLKNVHDGPSQLFRAYPHLPWSTAEHGRVQDPRRISAVRPQTLYYRTPYQSYKFFTIPPTGSLGSVCEVYASKCLLHQPATQRGGPTPQPARVRLHAMPATPVASCLSMSPQRQSSRAVTGGGWRLAATAGGCGSLPTRS